MIVFDVKQQTKGSSIKSMHVWFDLLGVSILCVWLSGLGEAGRGVRLQAEGEQTGPRLRHSPTFIETITGTYIHFGSH